MKISKNKIKMKVPKKGKHKKHKVIKKGKVSKVEPRPVSKEQTVLVVAQVIKSGALDFLFFRLLWGNEKKTRDRVLKALKKWLTNCFENGYEFKEEDFTRVWKGLFYAVWMSDKPLVQEELCENIAGILDLFPAEQLKAALLMVKAGFKMLATEWYGIDQHRMDKFLMLVRRYLRGSLRCLSRCEWSVESCEKYAKMLYANDGLFALKTPHYARNALSMQLHIIDCFLEELAKVSEGELPSESVAAILRPFTLYTCSGTLPALCGATRRLLTALLRQSEPGLQYRDKTRAWQKMGCPKGGPDALELVSDDEADTEELENGNASDVEIGDGDKPLDPRAGRVDVVLPLLPVPASILASSLRELMGKSTSKAHKRIKICMERFETLAAGQYPLQVSEPTVDDVPTVKPKRSIRALRALEAQIKVDTDELKLRGLSRKHRKRLLRKTRLGQSIVEEVQATQKASKKKSKVQNTWIVESTNTETESEKDTSNKENQNKKKEKKQKRKLEPQENGDVAVKKQKLEKKTKSKDIPKRVKEVKTENKISLKYTNAQKVSPKVAKVEDKKPKKKVESPKLLINKLKNYSKQIQKEKKGTQKVKTEKERKNFEKKNEHVFDTPKKVKFVLKNNSMQKPVDYYKSVRQSPSIPFDSAKKPSKTNLKPSTPSPINPFFKKKIKKH